MFKEGYNQMKQFMITYFDHGHKVFTFVGAQSARDAIEKITGPAIFQSQLEEAPDNGRYIVSRGQYGVGVSEYLVKTI